MSDTDTLVGSPIDKRVEGDEFETIQEDADGDSDGDADADAETRLLSDPQMSDRGGMSQREDGARGRIATWTFWDLMRWRPVRVMCMTMFLNSYVESEYTGELYPRN